MPVENSEFAQVQNAADERITVGQLRAALSGYPEDMEVVVPLLVQDGPHSYAQAGMMFEVCEITDAALDGVEVAVVGVTPSSVFEKPQDSDGDTGTTGDWVPAV